MISKLENFVYELWTHQWKSIWKLIAKQSIHTIKRERETGQEFTYPANLQAQMEGIKIQKLRNLQGRRLLRAHALWSHIHGLNPLMGEGSIERTQIQ